MFASRTLLGLVTLALASVTGLAGCAADSTTGGEDSTEESADELSAAGKALIGTYSDDSGAFTRLALTSKKVGQRNVFVADVDTGIRCFRAPCPAGEHIEGTFTAGKKTITLYSTTASPASQHLLGKYSYLAQGEKLSLSRKDFAQSLAKAPAIWPSDATKLVAKISGGFMPPPPPGSTCSNGAQYTLDRASRELSWQTCEFNGSNPRHLVPGSATLTRAQVATIEAALGGLEITTEEICGADKPFEVLTVSTPAGDKRYVDSFYACRGGSDVYVDNIGAVFGALRDAISE